MNDTHLGFLILDVSGRFQGCCFKNVSGVSFGRLMGVLRVIQKSSKGVLRKYDGCFKDVSKNAYESCKGKFQGCFKED